MLTLLEVPALNGLQITWFALVVVLWLGFFFLESFDFGVAMLLPILGRDSDAQKTDQNKRVMVNTIGPVWDGNEVWLLTAGGATFAAFPGWYATLFSALYLPLLLVLVGLIIRGVSFEYRSKNPETKWRNAFDWMATIGSLLASLVLGVGFANFVKGIPVGENMLFDKTQLWTGDAFLGQLFGMFTPFTLIGGVLFVAFCLFHGSTFLALKTKGEIHDRAKGFATTCGIATAVLALVFVVWQNIGYGDNPFLGDMAWLGWVGILAPVLFAVGVVAVRAERDGWAFLATGGAIVFLILGIFISMYGTIGFTQAGAEVPSLNMATASSSDNTLLLMTIVAGIFTPIVLAYQAWSYWVFSKRISHKNLPVEAVETAA